MHTTAFKVTQRVKRDISGIVSGLMGYSLPHPLPSHTEPNMCNDLKMREEGGKEGERRGGEGRGERGRRERGEGKERERRGS